MQLHSVHTAGNVNENLTSK